MKYTIFNMKGFEEYTSWLKEDKSKYEKINNLITSIQRDGPLNGIGKPEALKGNYKGNYSRRIDDKNRLIYQYQRDEKTGNTNTVIIGCKDHYKGQTQKEKLVSMLSITN